MSERILIVDDDTDALEVYRTRLVHAGYEVEVADSAEKALARVSAFDPGLVVTDVRMSGMSGLELLDATSRGHGGPRGRGHDRPRGHGDRRHGHEGRRLRLPGEARGSQGPAGPGGAVLPGAGRWSARTAEPDEALEQEPTRGPWWEGTRR